MAKVYIVDDLIMPQEVSTDWNVTLWPGRSSDTWSRYSTVHSRRIWMEYRSQNLESALLRWLGANVWSEELTVSGLGISLTDSDPTVSLRGVDEDDLPERIYRRLKGKLKEFEAELKESDDEVLKNASAAAAEIVVCIRTETEIPTVVRGFGPNDYFRYVDRSSWKYAHLAWWLVGSVGVLAAVIPIWRTRKCRKSTG